MNREFLEGAKKTNILANEEGSLIFSPGKSMILFFTKSKPNKIVPKPANYANRTTAYS